jgi:hypothetical protein
VIKFEIEMSDEISEWKNRECFKKRFSVGIERLVGYNSNCGFLFGN